MEIYKGTQTFYAKTRKDWRDWLEENHQRAQSVWLIIYRKESGINSIYYPEAVDESLCFGWIDSLPNKRDDKSYYQFFSKRNPKSNWSKVNKLKVEKLIEQNLMKPAGLAMIEIAKSNGTWDILDDVENIVLPEDLSIAFSKNKLAFENWENFSRSSKRGILEWILNAKKAETREKRINETVLLAAQNLKANHGKNAK
jgi:uncharacterized protein YdeI (YjbR/CyaY-like superfamily)